jgi:4-amino-4-deoxy-L-arabinose transferase-like glycosyltransferase
VVLAILASAVFLGFLGSVELWGKREQRAAAEAVDTVDHGHWLVAQIQGRPRLEKPPLPRWSIAALLILTGRREEWVVRLPGAFSALATVGLIYALGRRMGGRAVGLAAGLVLCSLGFFISELRQAGNDGPLTLCTTVAIYAAWRRLHGDSIFEDGQAPTPESTGPRRWSLAFHVALGLGFLTKGPIVIVLVAVALLPYLIVMRRVRAGIGCLADGWGLAIFLFLALTWPVAVLLAEPHALGLWLLEMGQKVGWVGFRVGADRSTLVLDWPWMTLPWVVPAALGAALPFLPRGRELRPRIWLPWFWGIGNLAMFGLWPVAKPSYYLPCLPAVALLIGFEWIRLARAARDPQRPSLAARLVLQLHWAAFFATALAAPVVAAQVAPQWAGPVGLCAATLATAVPISAWAWRRGTDAGALTPLVGALAVLVLVAYGALAPLSNPTRGHRHLAEVLDHVLPPEAQVVLFFREIDEGLWFYLRSRTLTPVPGSQPRYNTGFDMADDYQNHRLVRDMNQRLALEKQIFFDWLIRNAQTPRYVLFRSKIYDLFAADLEGWATPALRERNLDRNELILLRVGAPDFVAATSDPISPSLK